MNISKLTEILGQELAKEWSEDNDHNSPQQEDEFTVAEMMSVTGWTYAKVRWKVSEMLKSGRLTKRGKKTVFYKSTTVDKTPS
tara:strand:- start:2687 stop:2935 length:249 start_codon:yes stop_codon:yes gene_type:complete